MDRGNSLPCVLEQKVRAGDLTTTVGWASGRVVKPTKLNALRVLLEMTGCGVAGSREAEQDEWRDGMNPSGLCSGTRGVKRVGFMRTGD